MPDTLLSTKHYIPRLRRELVHRPRLIEQLDAGLGRNRGFARKLTLISAPAGYGKTTLLSEWIHPLPAPEFAWLSLDESDNDEIRFVSYFVAALQAIPSLDEAEVGETALAMIHSSQPPPIDVVLTSLINEIVAIPVKFALVLDDYHLIESQSIHDALTFLLDHLPPQMHLVIATRRDPLLPLARLRASGDMTEIRASDLRFTIEETTTFFNQMMGLNLTLDEVAALETRTEGWIAGLHLAALALQGALARPRALALQGPPSLEEQAARTALIRDFAGDNHHVMDYLVGEVLSRQSETVQRFLLHTAILDRLCGPLCDAVIDGDSQPDSSQAILEYLERANLFIVPLDNARRWYRYHHLFADLLRHRLRRAVGAQGLAPLHRRASNWYERTGLVREAIRHALAAGELREAARLVEQSARQMFVRSELATIMKWVDLLPDDLVRARPWLCIFHAWALRLSGGQAAAVGSRLQDAERAMEKSAALPSQVDQVEESALPAGEAHTILGHIAAIRACQALYNEEISRTIELAHQTLERLPGEDFVRGLCALALGWASRFEGDLVGASRAFTEARTASLASGNTYTAVAATCRLAYTRVLAGQLHQAVKSCQEAMRMATGEGGWRLPVAGYAHVYMGGVYREWNDLEAAARYLVEGTELCVQVGYIMDQVVGYTTLARVRLAQGDWNGARDACQRAQRQSQKMKGYVYARRWVEDCQVRLWLAQGELATAARWAQESGLSVDDEINFLRELEHIILARVLVAQGMGQPGEPYLVNGLDLLARLLEAAETAGWMGKAIEILALQAMAFHARGDTNHALAALGQALTLAEPEGYVRVFLDEGPPMARLLHEAAARGISPDYAHRLLDAFGDATKDEKRTPGAGDSSAVLRPPSLFEPLSERELQVLQLISGGLTNQEIASRLFLATNTVKVHTRNIYGKLNVHNRTQAVVRASDLGLL